MFFNRDFNKVPGRGISHIRFKNVSFHGTGTPLSVIEGYDDTRQVEDVSFEGLTINGKPVLNVEEGNIRVGKFVRGVRFAGP